MKESETKALIIREMTKEDVHEASLIEEEAFSMPWKESDFLEMISRPYAHYYVVCLGEKIIGICGVIDLQGEGDVSNVAIASSMRGRGFGSYMVRYVLDECRKMGMSEFTLEVRVSNAPAIALYKNTGFTEVGIRPKFYERPTEDALMMKLC